MAEFRPATRRAGGASSTSSSSRPADRAPGCPGVYGRDGSFEDIRLRFDELVTRDRGRRERRDDALPAGPAARPARDAAATSSRSRTWPARSSAFEGTEARGRRAGRASEPPRGLERVPADDRARPRAGRRATRSTRRSPPAVRCRRRRDRSIPAARTSSATSRRATRPGCRCSTCASSSASASPRRSPPGATRGCSAASSCCAASGSTPSSTSPPTRSSAGSGRMLAANQREQALKFEMLVPIAGPTPTAVASFNYHQDHFATMLRAEPARRRRGPHRVPRLRPRADRAGAAARRTASTGDLAGRGPSASCGAVMTSHAPAWSACSGSTRRPTGRTRSTTRARTYPETNCYTDILVELLHARGDEPLAALGSHGPAGLRGRPVDVLQAASRATSRGCSASTSTRCSRTGRCPTRSPSCSATGPDDDRRARCLVPARHGGHELPAASTSRRSVAAEAIDLDAASACATSTTRSLHELAGDDYRGVVPPRRRRTPTTSCRPTPSSCASMPGRGSAGDGAARSRARRCCATTCAARRRPTRSRASASGSPPTCRRCSRATRPTTTPTRSPRSAWPAPGFELLRVARRLAARRRAARAACAALARIVDGSKVLGFKLARRRPFDPEPALRRRSATAWDEAMATLDDAVG